MAVSTEAPDERRMLDALTDCMAACVWVAVVLYALVWVSFLTLIVAPGLKALVAGWCGISPQAVAIIWVAALALVKLTALTFAATAFGAWLWRRRVVRRTAH